MPSRNSGVPMRPAGEPTWFAADGRVGVARSGVADAAEAAGAGVHVGGQHLLRGLAQPEVGVAHDAGDDGAAALAGSALPEGELGLADRTHRLGAVGAVAGHAVDVHRGHDVVAGARVLVQLLDEVPLLRVVPEVVVGIDDRQLGLERSPRAPGRARRRVRGSRRRSQPRQGVAGVEAVDDVGRGVGQRAVEAAERVATALGVGVVGREQVQRRVRLPAQQPRRPRTGRA